MGLSILTSYILNRVLFSLFTFQKKRRNRKYWQTLSSNLLNDINKNDDLGGFNSVIVQLNFTN